MKKETRNKAVILLFFVAVIVFSLSLWLFKHSVLLVQEIPASLTVSDKTGFDVSPVFAFSEIRPGESTTRTVHISNDYEFPVYVTFEPRGDIKKFIPAAADFLQAGEEKDIAISAIVPADSIKGDYKGSVLIIVRKSIEKLFK